MTANNSIAAVEFHYYSLTFCTFFTLSFGEGKLPLFVALGSLAATEKTLALTG